MDQITIKIDDTILERMKSRMEKRGCKTLSQCARELFDLALRVEEAAESHEGKNDENDLSLVLKDLFKVNMIWSLESRFLIKFLIENWKGIESTKSSVFMEKAKERAATVVEDMMKQVRNA